MNETVKNILFIIKYTFECFFIFFIIYQLLVGMFCFYIKKDKPSGSSKKHKFAILVAARNEEKVIGFLLDSLFAQDYPRECYDIIVIADNCTDNTAAVAREKGVIVYERFNDAEKGKGFAVKFAVDILINERKGMYDAFCVFDADNLVMPKFLLEMNEMLNLGYRAAQGYRDIKNPSDSWISSNYALFYWAQNRAYNQPRANLGLSASVNGTGFMVKMDMVEGRGWITHSMTEDIEFTMNSISEGVRIGFARDAVIFDEQPTTFDASWKQRKRWTTGYLQCVRLCTGKLLKGAVKRRDIKTLDGTIFLLGVPLMFLGVVYFIVNVILALYGYNNTFIALLRGSFILIGVGYFISMIMCWLFMVLEGKQFSKVWKGILTSPFFYFTWFIINLICLVRPTKVWHPIEHNVDVSIDDVTK
ncbi:MAG: glycosyltransferase [Oscillospiraceae bacterium]|jgi:cellulose synthase/poly-beta-1,6-N-acetylglucosamine synthase-like glycosyltransferase|nr:glycosyltransferase [Oscillospiraceae bacterium]